MIIIVPNMSFLRRFNSYSTSNLLACINSNDGGTATLLSHNVDPTYTEMDHSCMDLLGTVDRLLRN